MGRHSRKGRGNRTQTDKGATPVIPEQGTSARDAAAPSAMDSALHRTAGAPAGPAPQAPAAGRRRPTGSTPAQGVPRYPDGTPAQGVPRFPDGTPARGVPRYPDGTPARGVPRYPDGTPAHGVPRVPGAAVPQGGPWTAGDGTPAQGVPRYPDGTPAQGVPRFPDGTPARGVPRFPGGTPAHGTPQVRGGHPQQRETGGGWGAFGGAAAPVEVPGGTPPRDRPAPRIPHQRSRPGPRQEYLDAFGADGDVFAPRGTGTAARPPRTGDLRTGTPAGPGGDGDAPGGGSGEAAPKGSGKGRTFTGIAAAAVTTVLVVIVAGQLAGGRDGTTERARSATDRARDTHDAASRGDGRPTASRAPNATTPTYEQAMNERYPLGADLKGPGKFSAVPGFDKAPGTGRKYTYRVDVEKGLGLDGGLFARAVQKSLNDDRSWAHHGARTFERISSGKPDFVITLASPGTTAAWCAKSGLDTTEDNVSCDSASTERVMINAYRWAQGSKTYGDHMYAYREMLINHEVGHRLGYGHVTCDKDGALAPVMQQQTKFLDHDGIHCLPNPWPYPGR
ncbi:DUF3152 domain-containing protein [Streptomyces sp. NPDC007264]|uniref:DUF3152 domain-containing protein n=1 Tax=Streptomyces sp. NPDC007264 TaxID=3364777 RepID=UPI0036D7CB35